jgi:hypothetical protein
LRSALETPCGGLSLPASLFMSWRGMLALQRWSRSVLLLCVVVFKFESDMWMSRGSGFSSSGCPCVLPESSDTGAVPLPDSYPIVLGDQDLMARNQARLSFRPRGMRVLSERSGPFRTHGAIFDHSRIPSCAGAGYRGSAAFPSGIGRVVFVGWARSIRAGYRIRSLGARLARGISTP